MSAGFFISSRGRERFVREGRDGVPAEFQRGRGLMVWEGQVATTRLLKPHSGQIIIVNY